MSRVPSPRDQGPHFICIGPGGSATTWLADHLKLQRDVWMPPAQEASYLKNLLHPGTHGLDLELRWDWWSIVKRVVRNRSLMPTRDREYYRVALELSAKFSNQPDLDGYRRLFAAAEGKLTGDIAPIYAGLSTEEIRYCLPVLETARIFMIARDPIARFWSAVSRHATYRTFGEVDYGSVETAQRLFRDAERQRQHYPTEILDRWEEVLGEGRIKVFYFDDVVDHPGDTFRSILDYIGSDWRYHLPLIPIGYNRKARYPRVSPSPEAREWVRLEFQDELRRCAARFGAHGERWLEKHEDGGGQVAARPAAAHAAR
jgi:hypothetical protein